MDSTPEQEELDPTVPHVQVRAVTATRATHGAWAVEDMLVFLDDTRVLHPDHNGDHRRHGIEFVLAFIPTHTRLTIVILATVMSANPKRCVRNFVTSVKRNRVRIRVAELLELDAEQLARLHDAEPRIHETQERQVGIIRKQRLRDFRNRGEVGVETEFTAKPLVEQDFGLNDANIIRAEQTVTVRRALDERRDIIANSAAHAIQFHQFANLTRLQFLSHDNLHPKYARPNSFHHKVCHLSDSCLQHVARERRVLGLDETVIHGLPTEALCVGGCF